MKLQVDYRESNTVIEILEQLVGNVIVTRLPIGDIATDKVVIEHKCVTDLVSSLINGRLYFQVHSLSKDPRASWIVIDGFLEEAERLIKKPINWKVVIGALASVSVRYGVNIVWLPTLRSALYFAYKVCEKVEEGKLGLPKLRRYIRKPPHIHPKTWLLMRALKIPQNVADRLLEKFGSPRAVFNATEEDLRKVEGIGKIRARRIVMLVS